MTRKVKTPKRILENLYIESNSMAAFDEVLESERKQILYAYRFCCGSKKFVKFGLIIANGNAYTNRTGFTVNNEDYFEEGETYILRYINENKEIIEDYLPLLETEIYNTVYAFVITNVIPNDVSAIGIFDTDYSLLGTISLNSLVNEEKVIDDSEEPLYSFGVLSDVHIEENQTSENQNDFKNALKCLNNKNVEFVTITGDLTLISHTYGLDKEMPLVQQCIDSVKKELDGIKPIYAVTGNHDCLLPSMGEVDIQKFFNYMGMSDVSITDDAEYSYEKVFTHYSSDGRQIVDHFLFLCLKNYNYATTGYSPKDLDWLSSKLENYKNERCFVFTHLCFPDYSGNFAKLYPGPLSGVQLTKLKALIETYPNSIWFNGHSHWHWDMQNQINRVYSDNANVYPYSNKRTMGWCVHIPSCAYPRRPKTDGTYCIDDNKASEGGIIDVYEDYIVVNGIVFKNTTDEDYINKKLPIAIYKLDTIPSYNHTIETGITNSENWVLNTNKTEPQNPITYYEDTKITEIYFDNKKEGYYFTIDKIKSDSKIILKWDKLEVFGKNNKLIPIEDINGIGFRHPSDIGTDNNYGYTLFKPVVYISEFEDLGNGEYGVQFNVSSSGVISNYEITNGITINFTNLNYKIIN